MAMKRLVLSALLLLMIVVIAVLASPWPSVLVIRAIFDHGAAQASNALEPFVPDDVAVQTGLVYDPSDPDGRLDIYRGKAATPDGPVVVWFHGGGFVSGRRADLANYLKILAGNGFTVVNVDYTIAPEATYPTPIRQANRALAFLSAQASQLKINANKMVLAGDSAGAQIAAQTAALVTNERYAQALRISPEPLANQIAGVLLYCGVYDITQMGQSGGLGAWFVKATAWAYSGKRDWHQVPGFDTMSITPYIARSFPRAFVSAGNADPLGPQSVALAAALQAQGVNVTSLFFPKDYQPQLGHEYQFRLDTDAGKGALAQSVAWLRSL